jgi:hypothetical protein
MEVEKLNTKILLKNFLGIEMYILEKTRQDASFAHKNKYA